MSYFPLIQPTFESTFPVAFAVNWEIFVRPRGGGEADQVTVYTAGEDGAAVLTQPLITGPAGRIGQGEQFGWVKGTDLPLDIWGRRAGSKDEWQVLPEGDGAVVVGGVVTKELEGKADLGTDGTVGGPDGSPLSPSVVSGSNKPVATPGVPHVVNVKDGAFGAKGNGTADDTAAFVSALAAVPSGGTLYLPPGTYKVKAQQLAPATHMRVEGAGMKATKIVCADVKPTVTITMFAPADATNFEITDLAIEGPAEFGGAEGRFDAVSQGGSHTSGLMRARRCEFTKFSTSLRVTSSVNWIGAVEAEECVFSGNSGAGAYQSMPILLNKFSPGARGRRLRVIDCDFYGFGNSESNLIHAIYVGSDWDLEIENNRFRTSVGAGYAIQIFDSGAVTEANGSPHQIIRGNRFDKALTVSAMVCGGCSRPRIEGNTFENVTLSVNIFGGMPVIRGNRFVNASTAGSHIATSGTPEIAATCVISENEFMAKASKVIAIIHNGNYVIEDNRFASPEEVSFYISVEGGTPSVRVNGNDFTGKGASGIMRISVAGSLRVKGNAFLTTGGTCVELNSEGATAVITHNDFSQSAGLSVSKVKTPATYVCEGNFGKAVGVQNVTAAATLTLPEVGEIFKVAGEGTEITKITAGAADRRIVLIINATAKLIDGENLKLKENLAGTGDDTISLVCDGTNWFETGRSVN